MAKKVQAVVKLQIPAGKANPSPPVGPALGQHGVNIMEFCKGFNAQTGSQEGLILPVVVTIYGDRSFTFVVKTPPAAGLLPDGCAVRGAQKIPEFVHLGGDVAGGTCHCSLWQWWRRNWVRDRLVVATGRSHHHRPNQRHQFRPVHLCSRMLVPA